MRGLLRGTKGAFGPARLPDRPAYPRGYLGKVDWGRRSSFTICCGSCPKLCPCFQNVELPVWALTLIVGFGRGDLRVAFPVSVGALVFPQAGRAPPWAELNKRLKRPIEPFKLMKRQDQVIRLVYDPQVMEAVRQHARDEGIPPNVAFEKARSYAREIVPGFSTATYFGFAIRLARRLGEGFYDVVVQPENQTGLDDVAPEDAIVFVMNHRSNMDYASGHMVGRAAYGAKLCGRGIWRGSAA